MAEQNRTRRMHSTMALALGIAAASGFRFPEYKERAPKEPNAELQAAAKAKRLRKQAKRLNKNIT